MSTRADQIFEAFKRFHAANPVVWELFERFAMQLVSKGRSAYSASAVLERIRWELNVETVGSTVKINNNFVAYYARLFSAKHPQHAAFFACRKRISQEKSAYADDVQVLPAEPAGDEAVLMAELRAL